MFFQRLKNAALRTLNFFKQLKWNTCKSSTYNQVILDNENLISEDEDEEELEGAVGGIVFDYEIQIHRRNYHGDDVSNAGSEHDDAASDSSSSVVVLDIEDEARGILNNFHNFRNIDFNPRNNPFFRYVEESEDSGSEDVQASGNDPASIVMLASYWVSAEEVKQRYHKLCVNSMYDYNSVRCGNCFDGDKDAYCQDIDYVRVSHSVCVRNCSTCNEEIHHAYFRKCDFFNWFY